MKRKKYIILSMLVLFIIAGCGKNSEEDGVNMAEMENGPGTAVVETIQKISAEDIARLDTDNSRTQGDNAASAEDIVKQEEDTNTPKDDNNISKDDDTKSKDHMEYIDEEIMKAVSWGLGYGAAGTQPSGNASAEDLKRYSAYYLGGTEEKVIYLTFDCGFENGNTEPILDALKKHEVQATFFVVGHYLETAPQIVQRMVEEGHAVGNHTYNHPDMSVITDEAAFSQELEDVASLFAEITGEEMNMYYRPPQGNATTDNLRMLKNMGYSTFFWSLAYVDWEQDNQPSKEQAFDKLLSRIHPGAIVLLHNTSKTNGEILDELLSKWEEMGYTFRPLSDLIK